MGEDGGRLSRDSLGSTNKYQNWETTDPERWVPHGYAVVRVDSRGAGWTPGFMNPASPREIEDLYQCIEWAGTQPWSNGKVGMLGISCTMPATSGAWRECTRRISLRSSRGKGQSDRYRDSGYHGGILCQFQERWAKHQVANIQHGRGDKAKKNPEHRRISGGAGHPVGCGTHKEPRDAFEELKKHPLCDEWHRSRSPDLSLVRTPLLTCANWGGQGIHPRGNFNGYTETPADTPKWLEAHCDSYWSLFSTDYGLDLQKRFFDYFLKGAQSGWDRQPRVQLNIRHPGERFVRRHENEWPLARTRCTPFYLNTANRTLSAKPVAQAGSIEYEALGDGVTFWMPPLEAEMEITGPMAARLFVSSSTRDADLFLIVRVFDPAGKELTFMGSTDPNTPIANGWLRASHRALEPRKKQVLAALSSARARRAPHAGPGLRMRRGDRDELHRGAGRVARCAHGAWEGLRV